MAGDAFSVGKVDAAADSLRLIDGTDKSPFLNKGIQSGGGGLVGTIDDYLKFTEMMRTGGAGLIGPKTLEFMMRNHLGGDIASMGPRSFAEQPMEGMGFGLGGAVLLDPGRARAAGSIGDFSWGGMASTFFWIDPVHDLSVIFFTQLIPSSAYPARPQLKALVHGALT
jgi:CubicO group peptidase (beta-lactamase class C family)